MTRTAYQKATEAFPLYLLTPALVLRIVRRTLPRGRQWRRQRHAAYRMALDWYRHDQEYQTR
jgi:hypothetical protein